MEALVLVAIIFIEVLVTVQGGVVLDGGAGHGICGIICCDVAQGDCKRGVVVAAFGACFIIQMDKEAQTKLCENTLDFRCPLCLQITNM